MSEGPELTREQLEAAIAAQEGLRATLGDAVVDATIGALRAKFPDDDVPQHRKLVTVLFADVVGSTTMMSRHDPEETMAVMDSALARLAVPVRAHGGRVTRFMGDGLMAVFGLPTARENDPEMAIRAGLGIVEESARIARDLEAEHGIAGFQVRVGVNTGLVVTGGVTEAADTIMGNAVNLAARLESAAEPGTVLIAHDARQHVRDRFEFEDHGEIVAKGFPEPVRTYRVLRQLSGDDARGIEGVDIPMVGREAELADLLDDLADVAGGGGLRCATLIAEAGLGKSRLTDEFRDRLDPEVHERLATRAMSETRRQAYALVKTLLERRYRIRTDDGAAVAREQLVAGITADLEDEAAEAKAHFIGQLIGYDFSDSPEVRPSLDTPRQLRSRAVMHLTELVSAIAGRACVVMVIEDLHWADADSLDVLDAVLDGLADQPVLVLATSRPTTDGREERWAQQHGCRQVRLGPLSASQAQELTDLALRRIEACPDSLRSRLVEHAGGNPYYLEEMIRMLIDDGVVVTGSESWTVDLDRFSEMRIPPTLTGVIQARLDSLPRDQRVALQQASVVGRVFWDTIVAELAAVEARDADVGQALDALDRREMIHRLASSRFADTDEFAFHHEIQRSVAYEGVLVRVRRTYHSIVADWLIANRGDRAAELSGLIAGHLERAGRLSEALTSYEEAAQAALTAYAVEAADGFFERALELLPAGSGGDARRFALLLGRERTLGMRGLNAEQRAVIDELATLTGDDPEAVTVVGMRRLWSHYFAGEYAQAVEGARAAIASAERTGDLALVARTRAAHAVCLFAAGELETSRAEAELALDQASQAGDLEAQDSAHTSLGLILLANSELSAARDHLLATLATADELGDLKRKITGTINLGVLEMRVGNYAAAREAFETTRGIGAEFGDRHSQAFGSVNLAWAAASLGDWPAAITMAEDALRREREIVQPDAVAETLMWLGNARVGEGSPELARAAFAEALEIRQELGQETLVLAARAGIARAALAAGDLDEARGQVKIVLDHLDGGGTLAGTWEPMRIHLTCVQVLRAAGDPDADRVLARARDLLLEESGRITAPEDRRTFLEQVPWHRELLELSGSST